MCGDDKISRQGESPVQDDFPWHIGVYDVHNHIAERPTLATMIPTMRARGLAIMATRTQDQCLVASLAKVHGLSSTQSEGDGISSTVVPGFGRHPWFSHELYDDTVESPSFHIDLADTSLEVAKMKHYSAVLTPPPTDAAFVADLPTPLPLSSFIEETRGRLKEYPLAVVGEIGLDRAFRLPTAWEPGIRQAKEAADPERTPGGRMQRPLSNHRIDTEHQKTVLLAQLRLAGEMQRAVSVHGVQAHGILFDLLVSCWNGSESTRKARRKAKTQIATADSGKFLHPPRICLHSFSGQAPAVRQYLNRKFPVAIFFSFSKTNNMRDQTGVEKMTSALSIVPENRILVESDLHVAGQRMDDELAETYQVVCKLKGWTLEYGVRRIARNWEEFIFGTVQDGMPG